MESVNTLIETISGDISRSLHKSLQPFVSQIENDRLNYNALLTFMRGLPEYKSLVSEVIELKKKVEDLTTRDDDVVITNVVRSIKIEPCETLYTPVKSLFAPAHVIITAPEPETAAPETAHNIVLEECECVLEQIKLEIIEDTKSNEITSISDKVKRIYLDANIFDTKIIENKQKKITPVEEEEEDEEEEAEEEEIEDEVEDEIDVEEVEEVEEEAEEDEEEEEVEEVEEVEEEEEVFIVEVIDRGVSYGNYYTTNITNGKIYQIEKDTEEVGIHAGSFFSGIPSLF